MVFGFFLMEFDGSEKLLNGLFDFFVGLEYIKIFAKRKILDWRHGSETRGGFEVVAIAFGSMV